MKRIHPKGLKFMKTTIIIVHLVICVAIIAIVVLQSGKTSGLSGALSGSSDTFLSKNKSKTLDARLARATKWFAGIFLILTIVLNLI
ncbi:MAG: preprotein translocase subunit SecG [Oscillospiraceae bacterium]|nr:preprotein translocase subunit SecG [Oscillospiraceae bacterium]